MQGARQRVELREAVGREGGIPGQKLVAAVAAERDGHVLPGEPGQQVGRQDRRVGERLVEEVGHGREQSEHHLGGEDVLVMVGAEVLRDAACVIGLVEARARRSRSRRS